MRDEYRFEGEDNGSAEWDGNDVRLSAASHTDWFHKPDGSSRVGNVARLVRAIDAPVVAISARVSVDFAGTYDAGALFVQLSENDWAKLAYERSAAGEPTIVSVVTRGTSDDADGPITDGGPVWLRVYTDGRIVAFHDSSDGRFWRFRRLFTLPGIEARPLSIGLGAQSPVGEGTVATFTDIRVSHDPIANMRDGS